MRTRCTFVVLAVLLFGAQAHASEFSEFTIPTHTWSTWGARIAGHATSSDRNSLASSASNSWEQYLAGLLTTNGSWSLDSEAWQARVALGVTADFARSGVQNVVEYPRSRSERAIDAQGADERLSFSFLGRAYPWAPPWGASLEILSSALWRNLWMDESNYYLDRDTRITNTNRGNTHNHLRSGEHRAVAGLVYGRVRDATGVYEAWLLERRLLETGALSRELSPGTRERIAALYYMRSAYAAPHDRPERFFWQEVEKVLREDGALAREALDAYSAHYLLEYYSGVPIRRTGFVIGPQVVATHRYASSDLTMSVEQATYQGDTLVAQIDHRYESSRNGPSDFVSVGAAVEYHLPLGMRTQIDLSSSIAFPTKEPYDGFEASSQGTVQYVVADRFRASLGLQHLRRVYEDSMTESSSWRVLAQANLSYYLEDRLAVTLTLQDHQEEQHAGQISGYYRSLGAVLSLSYTLLGRLDAGDLIAPVRPLDPAPPGY